MAIVAAMTWGAAPATATTIDRSNIRQTYEQVRWDCGYPVHVAGVARDVVVIRADKALEGNVFITDSYAFTETWTATDGRYFTQTASGIAKDVKAKRVGETLYQFTYNNSGQVSTIVDSSGRVVFRDRGNLSYTYTVDVATGAVTFLGVRISGPHPGGPDICKVAAPLVGTESARYLTPKPVGSTDFPMGFYEYLPPSYVKAGDGNGSPLLVVLNGYGENGDGSAAALPLLLNTGIPRFIDVGGWPTDRPLVVLALQHFEEAPVDFTPCEGLPWGGSCAMYLQDARNNAPPNSCTTPDEAYNFIAYALRTYNVDPKRVYLTGLSCGGYGTWAYVAKYGNQQIAAAIPIAGEGRPAWDRAGCKLGTVALWAFHGELDDTVNPLGSIEPMTNLAACAGVAPNRAKLTIYPGLYHDGWNQAYSGSLGDDIYSWMLSFSR